MTRPGTDGGGLAPARRNRGRLAAPDGSESDAVDRDVARGQSDALLGALARLHLRLDVLAREQNDAFAAILDRLSALEKQQVPPRSGHVPTDSGE